VPEGWYFLAVSLQAGGIDTGTLTVTIDDQQYTLASQVVDADSPQVADWLGGAPGAVLDELAVFQRALSEQEIMAVRAVGLDGIPFTSVRAAVVPEQDDAGRHDN